jgi:hypothetical protein
MSPPGSMVQPSSSFWSNLPVPVVAHDGVVPVRVRMASWVVQQLACMYFPFGRMMLWASPIVVQPLGAARLVQVLVAGLYSAPEVVQTGLPLLYSPPMITTSPLGSDEPK